MDNKKEIKQFNKKLLIVLFVMLSIFATLLVTKSMASIFVPAEIESLKQTDRPNPTYLTYNDLVNYYDILCCQHQTPLNGEGRCHLTGSHSQGSFDYFMGEWQDTGYKTGSQIERHTIYSQTNDFDADSYTHMTYGYYSIVEQHIATPKEAYIIAEMKKEIDAGPGSETSSELIYHDGQAQAFTGSLVNSFSIQLSTGEMAYTVNQKYVLKTPDGNAYYVKAAKDSDGNVYYVYETSGNGALVPYDGDYTYTDPITGEKTDCVGIAADNIYYEHNGEITDGSGIASSYGTLYLVEYDVVIDVDGDLYYANVSGHNSYIQIAWWTTDMGTSHGTVAPSSPNALSKEAEAFEDYILTITNKASVKDLQYEYQSYDFFEEDGTHSVGQVKAPVIEYEPGFNDDADQNGVINEADEFTASFDYSTNKYVIGPFSINYVLESAEIPTRPKVDFSTITGVKLDTNLGELVFGEDWNFHFLADQGRDPDDEMELPRPNEVFYIDINYIEGLTEIKEFSFGFKYMNAGAHLDIYDGNYNEVTWTVKHQDTLQTVKDKDGNSHNVFKQRDIWLECTSVIPHDSQTLAHALVGARWYNYGTCKKELSITSGSLRIEKRVYSQDEEAISIDRTYLFKVYINGKEFQHLAIRTRNGYGYATTVPITWKDDEQAPTYEVVELGNYTNNGPWSGRLEGQKTVVVEANNYITPYRGKIEIDKRLLNPTPALETETFHFTVSVTGTFGYNGGPIQTYTSRNPLKLDATIVGASIWISGEFRWYGSAPKYNVVENIPENATYELVNGVINNGNGYIFNSQTPTKATATNTPVTDWTVVEVDKRMVSNTKPEAGEVFTAKLTITGRFSYNGDAIQDRTEEFNITLDSSNNWNWKSAKILWRNGEVPKYTLQEVSMADGTRFVSISDEVKSGSINNFSSKLHKELTYITITNEREQELIGKLKINKFVENEDLCGKTFTFRVTVSGTFKYLGVQYTNQTITFDVPITVPAKDPSSDKLPTGEWKSDVFTWERGEVAPRYTVEEINLPAGSKFVSISNGLTVSTSTQSISGSLYGRVVNAGETGVAAQTVVTCINGSTRNEKQGHIVIVKESIDEALDDYVFFFKVTITGTFKYYNVVKPDGSLDYTQYTNETLVLNGKIDDVEAVCGGEDWVSELIVWDEGTPAPRYTVEEISIPANVEFVSISNRSKTSTSTKIDGTLSEGTENNYITAINKPGENFVDGSIRIAKKTSEDLKGKIFHFNLKITGEFDYAGKHYGSDSPNGNTYTLENIEVEGNGNPWVSGIVTWNEDGAAPTYEVTEVNLPAGSHFVSISNETEICTDGSMKITGTLNLTKPVKVVAINYGENLPKGSHIEITKEVLNEKLKGTNFYFNVRVWSSEPFRYHDIEDATKVTVYNPGDVLEFKNVVAVADEKDWVSGYIEWDGDVVPQYEISEITSAFPDGVKSVSIRKDTEIIVKELTNTSGENLVVTGNLAGDITHIIAVNDAEDEIPVQGRITIEKKALSEIIEGEEFTFSLTVTGKFKYQGKEYRKLEIKDIKITANGPVWTSDYIEWYEEDGAPTYTVTEETATFANGVEFVSIRNAYQSNTQPAITGTVKAYDNWVVAENTFAGYDKGRIQIHKVLLDEKGNQIDGVNFTFKVVVTFADGTTDEQEVTVASGGYWRSDWYSWSKRDEVPTYHIEEIDHDGYEVEIDKPDGELIAQNTEENISGIVSVVAQNTYLEEHKAQIRVNKDLIVNDKVSEDDVTVNFTFLVKVTGTFTYKGVAYNDETLTLKVVVSKDSGWTWLSDEFCWNGDEAPIFIVEEPSSDMPVGWHLVSTQSSSEDNRLVDGSVLVVDVTNEWDYDEELILTMKLGGKVWDDTNRTLDKHIDALENGVIDDGEPGISNVKVTIYRALVDKASGQVVQRIDGVYAYDENDLSTRISNVTYTDDNGNWSFGAVSVPALTDAEKEVYGDKYCVTYDVEFEYDGQTFEPTEFLATAGGQSKSFVGADATNNMYSDVSNRWSTIINSSTSERDKYLYDSMAVDDLAERTNFNNQFADIQGKEVMDDEGNTVGTTGSGKELNYSSVDSVSFFNSDNSRKISTLETVDENGEILDDLKITAATGNSNLTFPFYTEDPMYDRTAWHLRGWDKTITDVFKITYKFEAIYNYCLSINLGLVEREGTDLAIEKDLSEALVVVNGKALKYKFNSAIDLEDPNNTELLYKQLAVADAQIEYKLGLYSGDYYYRASIYDGSEAGSALDGFYTRTLNLPLETSEMEIYLKYTINAYNQSETYDVVIGEIADYYDGTFKLVTEKESRYVQTLNGEQVDSVIEVASPSTVKYLNGMNETGNGNVTWAKVKDCEGSDGIKYSKLTSSSLAGHKLETGEKASITVTFKVDKDSVGESGVLNAIKLGKKHNVAEITKFTSYYSGKSENRWSTPGQISGRVDEDSAPDNVNIEYYNDKAYYEDDTDSAPIITIGISDENRAISGIVWDDAQTKDAGYGQIVGNGLYSPDEGDKLINGITTEIYESITVPETDDGGEKVYKEYQFAWPTESPIAALGGHSVAELTGFHQATVTENGEYSFINLPAGNYKVRYVYGDKQIETGKSGSEEVYNGQDYKSTAYQIGFNNDRDNDGYVDNEWHDISNNELNDLRVNDARDNEARRLYISAKSEMLTFDNTTLLATADDKNADHTELFGNYNEAKNTNPIKGEGYYMYAETAKINLGVENIYKVKYTTETIGDIELGVVNGKATQNGRDVGTSKFVYDIRNIDCGIEERSQTKITLDKQIKEIRLMTSDNKTILDAVYDISYTMKSDGSISSTVTLNQEKSIAPDHIASLNRSGYSQGYRYLIVDGQILQGTQIQVTYQLTVFNMSETDRISKDLDTLWTVMNTSTEELKANALESAMNKVSSSLYTESKGRVYNDGTGFKGVGYGTYFGSVYYLGSQGVGVRPDETIVKTKVHQMIDYVDPDIEYTNMDNSTTDRSWTNTEIAYLLDNHLIDPATVQILDSDGKVTGKTAATDTLSSGERYSIISDKLQEYVTESKNNLILTMDDGENGNPGFIKFLEPYMASSKVERATGSIALTVSRFFSSELDANDVDNLAEIIKFENTAGRRDARNIAGNANPYELDDRGEPVGVYAVAQGKEKDASATELITLSPPTGLSPEESRTMQLILVILISITIVAVAIVIIKKKVLVQK